MPAKILYWSEATDEKLLQSLNDLNKTIKLVADGKWKEVRPQAINAIIESCKTHIGYINEELNLRGIQNEAE